MSLVHPLKLCFISNPQSIHTRRWLEWFAARGHTVQLIADAPLTGEWPGVETYDLTRRFNIRVVRFAVWALLIMRLLRVWRPDILHAHRVSSAGWLGAASGYHPFVVAPWGSDLLQHPDRSRVARKLASFVLRRADWVVVNSNATRERALYFGAHPDHISMIQFGINLKVFNPDQDPSRWRQQLGLGDGPVLLSSRGVSPIYNTDTILEAFAAALQSIPTAKLVLFLYNVNKEYMERLQNEEKALGIQASICWVGPFLNQEEIARLYNLADVIVSVPSSDSSPSSVLEAMACSKPVIVTDLPALHDWIVDGQNGIFVPVRDAGVLTDAVVRLLSSPDECRSMGKNSRQVIAERANYDTEMAKMEKLYYSLLESSKHGR